MPKKSDLELDRLLGLEYYGLEGDGTGGYIRRQVEDFIVNEVSIDGLTAGPSCDYPSSEEGYWWFVMEKRGIDTVTALIILSKQWGLRRNTLSAAGLKDSKAITYQFVSVLGDFTPPKERADLGRVSAYCFFKRPFYLKPGLLYGNRFKIWVRDASKPENLEPLIEELKRVRGVPNYYGYQRFGTIRPNTHLIGKYIIQGRYREAVEELVQRVYPREYGRVAEARRYVAETGDYAGAAEMLPSSLRHEKHVVRYLANRPGDYYGALRSLPLYIRRLFVGAYQAYLFNKILSRRIRHGLSYFYPHVGDFIGIYPEGSHEPKGLIMVTERLLEKSRKLVEEGRAALMLPIVGYRINLGHGEPGRVAREVLAEEGVDLGDFRVKGMPEASSTGTYRRAALVPEDFSADVRPPDYSLAFKLRKGMYATVLLREFIKPTDLIEQGF